MCDGAELERVESAFAELAADYTRFAKLLGLSIPFEADELNDVIRRVHAQTPLKVRSQATAVLVSLKEATHKLAGLVQKHRDNPAAGGANAYEVEKLFNTVKTGLLAIKRLLVLMGDERETVESEEVAALRAELRARGVDWKP